MRGLIGVVLCLLLVPGCTKSKKRSACFSEVVVSLSYPGASPAEVETGAVAVVEDAVAQTAGVASVTSWAGDGTGMVYVEVKDDAGVDAVLTGVHGAVANIVAFPDAMDPPIVFRRSGQDAYFVVSEENVDEPMGGPALGQPPPPHLEIELDPARLEAYGVDIEAITGSIREAVHQGQPIDVNTVAFRTPANTAIKLGDVASIRVEASPLPRAYRGESPVIVRRVTSSQRGPKRGSLDVDVVGPLCGSTSPVVSLAASFPVGTEPEEVLRTGRHLATELARDDPRALVIVGDRPALAGLAQAPERIEVIAPAGNDPEKVVERIARRLMSTPGLTLTDVAGIPSAVTLDVAHADRDVREQAVQAILAKAQSEEGVYVAVPPQTTRPTLAMKLGARGRALGLTEAEIARRIRTALMGEHLEATAKDGQAVSVRVAPPLGSRQSLEALTIVTPTGEHVALGAVATIYDEPGPAAVHRRDQRRIAPLTVFGPGLGGRGASQIATALIEAGTAVGSGVSVTGRER
jgi:multidrug efflux pump subunit AcrB